MKNNKIEKMDLSYNNLGYNGLIYISETKYKELKGLKELNLKTNDISDINILGK